MSELQIVIEAFIRENGGPEKLIHDIECEWCKSFYSKNNYYSHMETMYLLANYRTKTNDYIARNLGRTPRSVKNKISSLREKAMIDYRKI